MRVNPARLAAGCLALVAMLVMPTPLRAQATTGTIEGQVKDQQGASLPGVVVTATNTGTAGTHSAVTTENGLFRLTYLPIGTYNVLAEIAGFQSVNQRGVNVGLNQTVSLNFTLGLAGVAEVVDVVAETTLVQTTQSELRRTYDERALLDRPLTIQVSGFAGRSVYNFATLAPGITTPGPRFDRAFLGSGGSNVIANGTTARSANFELDGISNVDPEDNDYRVAVSVEGVKEFEVITSNYNAEFGRAGGAQSRAVSKSGANAFHGSAYEYFYDNAKLQWPGNSELQQKRCSDSERAATPSRCYAEYNLNIYGVTLGGPIVRDKAFFFAMFENNRRRGENFYAGSVPLASERTPNTGSAEGDRIVSEWLSLYPLPNRPEINPRRYETNEPYNYDTPNPFIRTDFNISNTSKLMARYDYRSQNFDITRIFPSNAGDIVDRAQTAGTSYTHTFSPTMVGEFRFGYAYRRVDLPVEEGFETMPTITNTVVGTLGAQSNQYPIFRKLHDYQAIGSLTWVKSRHSIKGGYDLHRTFNNGIQSDAVRGLIAFGTGYGRTGIENLLAGTPTAYTLTTGNVERNFRYWDVSFFVQDDWRILDNVTLNLGLRNEGVTEWTEKDDKTDFGYNSSMLNLAPRVGAAWDIKSDGQWVVRGAYGLSYDRINFFFLRSLQFQPPVTTTISLLPPLHVADLVGGGTPVSGPVARNEIDPDFGLGKVHTWNATVEHPLFRNSTLRVSYIGSATRGLPSMLVLNRAVPGDGATAANRPNRRPDPAFSNILHLANASDGNYRALQVAFDKKYSHGLQYQLSYTWARARDIASDAGFGSGDLYFSMLWNADIAFAENGDTGPRKDDMYGPTRYDMRHVFSFNGSYELPWKDVGGIAGWLVNDWQVGGTVYYRDGYPVNVTCGLNGGDCNIDGVAADRPNVVDDSVVGFQFKDKPKTTADTQTQHILPTAFDQVIAPGQVGTLDRNQFRVDDFLNVDMAIIRNIDTWKNQRAQFRFELYNVFNNTYAGTPGLSLANLTTFGRISGVGGTRSVQLAFKYLW